MAHHVGKVSADGGSPATSLSRVLKVYRIAPLCGASAEVISERAGLGRHPSSVRATVASTSVRVERLVTRIPVLNSALPRPHRGRPVAKIPKRTRLAPAALGE